VRRLGKDVLADEEEKSDPDTAEIDNPGGDVELNSESTVAEGVGVSEVGKVDDRSHKRQCAESPGPCKRPVCARAIIY
jgi:hypothetical protein